MIRQAWPPVVHFGALWLVKLGRLDRPPNFGRADALAGLACGRIQTSPYDKEGWRVPKRLWWRCNAAAGEQCRTTKMWERRSEAWPERAAGGRRNEARASCGKERDEKRK